VGNGKVATGANRTRLVTVSVFGGLPAVAHYELDSGG
jgi:hypothetical protein